MAGTTDTTAEVAGEDTTLAAGATEDNNNNEETLIPEAVFKAIGARAEDIHLVCGLGFNVNNDNKPALEKIPTSGAPAESIATNGNKKAKCTDCCRTWETVVGLIFLSILYYVVVF